jgi:hypothetical protein
MITAMTILRQRAYTMVDRVQILSRHADALAAQQKIGSLLRNSELHSSSLPPAAILIVRKLHGQEPETGWSNYKSIYLPAGWQQSATRQLDRLSAIAARPVLAPAPASAPAVLFADYAELLACLAQDWLRGDLRKNWWWSTFLKRRTPEACLQHEWMHSPEFVPAAIEILAAHQCAVEFVRRLPDHIVLQLLDNVVAAFAIPRLVQPAGEHESSIPTRKERMTKPADETWLPLVREAFTRGLPPAKRSLLAQALMLRRAPALARAVSFQQQLARWAEEEHFDDPPAEESADKPKTIAWIDSARNDPHHPPHQQDNTVVDRIQSPHTAYDLPASRAEFATGEIPGVSIPAQHAADLIAPKNADLIAPRKKIEAFGLLAPSCIQTALGGIFFLLNVAIHLKLYADFTCPRGGNLELDVWDFLYLLGQRFVSPERQADAVFHLLTELSGRSTGEEPGEKFIPPDSWRLPPHWLDAFPETFEQQEVVCNGRRLLHHPGGFLLVDEPLGTPIRATQPLLRWLNWIAPYIEARLVRALGRNDAAQFLCSIPARVDFTPTHVDVSYPLDFYPVEIRTAGLDRDPGWVPAAGRFLAFHFE